MCLHRLRIEIPGLDNVPHLPSLIPNSLSSCLDSFPVTMTVKESDTNTNVEGGLRFGLAVKSVTFMRLMKFNGQIVPISNSALEFGFIIGVTSFFREKPRYSGQIITMCWLRPNLDISDFNILFYHNLWPGRSGKIVPIDIELRS